MPSRSAKYELTGFSIGVLYYLWLGTLFVPLSSQSYDSWAPFLKSWTIRLVVSVVFLALTRRVLKIGTVATDRVTPTPPDAPAPPADQPLTPSPAPRLWPRWKVMLILAASVAAFAMRLVKGAHSYLPFHFSPRTVTALAVALFGSLCAAALAAILLAVTVAWIQKPHLARPNRAQQMFLGICVLYAASWWVLDSQWLAGQPWFAPLTGNLAVGAISLFTVVCFAILWLPKPTDQPDLLHVAPRTAERR